VKKQQGRWQVEEVWQSNRCSPQVGNYLRVKDQVIAPANGGSANMTVCLNLNNGSLAWKERFGGRGTLIRLRDGIATLNESGDLEIRQLQASKSIERFRFPSIGAAPQWSSPAIVDNMIVIQSANRLQAWQLGKSSEVERND
jgi:outer membrane protein assembly factor BamB